MVIKRNCDGIALIAIPRTGTNFLCYLLNHHPLFTFYYEIFHPDKFYLGEENNYRAIIENLNQKYSRNFVNLEDANLIEWINNNPNKLINILMKNNLKQYIGFKLFPDQLDYSKIESTIIKNHKIKKVLIKRNLLDSYISFEIAMKINIWNNFDTSEICLTLSIEKFTQWVDWSNQWYQFFEDSNYLSQENFAVIHYEDIHSYKTNTEKLVYLDRILQNIGINTDQELTIPNVDNIKIMLKQDNRKNLKDKIINYQEFIEKAQEII